MKAHVKSMRKLKSIAEKFRRLGIREAVYMVTGRHGSTTRVRRFFNRMNRAVTKGN
jgi:hypothetical protein